GVTTWAAVVLPFLLLIAPVLYALRILREYERAVVFMLGRFWKVKGPGLVIIVPFVQQMVRVDLRMRVLDIPPQDVISRDNVSVKVSAVVYYRVIDPERAIIQVEMELAEGHHDHRRGLRRHRVPRPAPCAAPRQREIECARRRPASRAGSERPACGRPGLGHSPSCRR